MIPSRIRISGQALRTILSRLQSMIARRLGSNFTRTYGIYKRLKYTTSYDYRSLANPFRMIFVKPSNINRYIELGTYHFNIECFGEMMSGDWDKQANLIEDHRKFKSIKSHFSEGVPWEETSICRFLENHVKSNGPIDGVSSTEEIRERYENIDDIYDRIKEDGYKSQIELNEHKNRFDEICISIGRDGELLFTSSGWHRLSIAKILDIERVPTYVIFRHRKWQNQREEVLRQGPRSSIYEKYQNHPDLVDISEKFNH